MRKANDRKAKTELIKSKIDYRDVERIFDDVIDEELKSGVVMSLVNFSMLCVIVVSGYLWFKLNKAENFWDTPITAKSFWLSKSFKSNPYILKLLFLRILYTFKQKFIS